jgi:hypothetical protein
MRPIVVLCQKPLPSLGLVLWCIYQPATPLPILVLWYLALGKVTTVPVFRQVKLHVRLSKKILL